jgi:hypothetical protein
MELSRQLRIAGASVRGPVFPCRIARSLERQGMPPRGLDAPAKTKPRLSYPKRTALAKQNSLKSRGI